jgi:hypothetical protein
MANETKNDSKVHLRHCNQGEYKGSCKYGDDQNCPALKLLKKCPALEKHPKAAPNLSSSEWLDPEIEKALAECHHQCEQSEQGKSALAWMKAQAKALDSRISEDSGPLILSRVISSHIVVAKRKVRHRKVCTCKITEIEDSQSFTWGRIEINPKCPFHKKLIA